MLLPLLFLITAALYATVGFGGGSTYNALLVLAGVEYRFLPFVSLACNLIVVSGGVFRFTCAGHLVPRQILPWIMVSVPMAWLGGYLPIPEKMFVGILGLSLLAAGFLIIFQNKKDRYQLENFSIRHSRILPFIVGGGLGFLAGLTGIGGGIFLAPVLYLLRWGHARTIAGTCSLFILVNSLAGLAGHMMKLDHIHELYVPLAEYWMLFPAVFIGGQLGSYMGALRLRPDVIRIVTAILMLYVASKLLWRWWGLA
ncbi:MAG: sulfite exporter TauE/SafE family protein [Micavibrio sp.]